MITSIAAENAFDKNPHTFMTKTLKNLGKEENYLNIIKVIYKKAIANIVFSSE